MVGLYWGPRCQHIALTGGGWKGWDQICPTSTLQCSSMVQGTMGLSCDGMWAWGRRWLPVEIVNKKMIKNVWYTIILYTLVYIYNIYIYIACLTHLRRVVTRQVLQGVGIFMDFSDRVQRDWLVEVVPSLELSHYIRSYHESEEAVLHLSSPTFTQLRILRMSSNHMSILRTQSNSIFGRVCWGGLLLPAAHDSAAEPQARCTLHWVWWYLK